jgi:aminoglycoside phosphotransferase
MARKGDVDFGAVDALLCRVFPGSACRFTRAESGASTQVYRVWRGDEVCYLRIAEGRDASLAPEVQAHTLLRARGVSVPEVIYYEVLNADLERDVMITTEIPGEPVASLGFDAHTPGILRQAGRDLRSSTASALMALDGSIDHPAIIPPNFRRNTRRSMPSC